MKHIALLLTVITISCTITLPISNDWETIQPDRGNGSASGRVLSMMAADIEIQLYVSSYAQRMQTTLIRFFGKYSYSMTR